MMRFRAVLCLALALAAAAPADPIRPPTVTEAYLGPSVRFNVTLDERDLRGFCNAITALPSGYRIDHPHFRLSRQYAARVLDSIRAQTTIIPTGAQVLTIHGGNAGSCKLVFCVDSVVEGKPVQYMMVDVHVDMRAGEARGYLAEYAMFSRGR